ncbi:MAG: hypothetical protein ACI8WW_001493, partial [Oceanospirillaceae bacterium]
FWGLLHIRGFECSMEVPMRKKTDRFQAAKLRF